MNVDGRVDSVVFDGERHVHEDNVGLGGLCEGPFESMEVINDCFEQTSTLFNYLFN